jgi:hypothetical protein
MKKLSVLIWSSLILGTLLLAGCGPTAHIQKDKDADFSQYKTFAWSVTADNNLKKSADNSIVEQQIKEAVNKELLKQGWREVKRKPDVLLNYDVLVERSTQKQSDPVYSNSFTRTFYNPYRRRFYSVYYPSQLVGYDNYEVPVKEGTITISMTDNSTDKLVWQGWSTNEIDSKNLSEKDVQSSVKAIFRKFDVVKN